MEYRKLSELKKLPGNPRLIKDREFQTLCQSIKDNPKYFEARPLILSNRTGDMVILAGNQRYEAAKVVKLKQVPTFLIEGLTEEKEKEIIIRDNVSNGEWDFDILANEWDDLPLIEWGVKMNKFDINDPANEWKGMPEFENPAKAAKSLIIHFETIDAMNDFSQFISQDIGETTKFIWYPKKDRENKKDMEYQTNES